MPQLSQCDPNLLRRLLDGELDSSIETEVTLHVERCDECRRGLEALAADESWWQGTRNALSSVTDAASLEPRWITANGERPESATPVPLDFLQRSDNPAMLGRLGEFEILELIGSGGMGIVLKGYDRELNRYVAVKVLHPHCATSAAARRRFAREAQAAAAIVHPHVVAIHAVDANHHPPFLVMSYIPGESLQQRLNRQGPFDVVDVLRIGQQVAEGLAAAHAQGLVHRDIKPGNILLERNVERVLLTDFGLARAADDASLTQSGVIAGTPQFMSPEQTRGDIIDYRTDLFSLGTVMYTLLAGHSPFRAETAMGVLRRVCDDQPRPLREANPTVPAWLEALIGKLQSKQPAQRFQTADQVAEQLKQCLAHLQQPTRVRLPADVALLTKRSQQRWFFVGVVTAFVATVLFAMVTLGKFTTSSDGPQNSTQSPSSHSAGEARTSNETAWTDQHPEEAAAIHRGIKKLELETVDQF